ncbi:centrosomal protein of 126 kDa isoform X2 [Tachysurus fulvidraco]|uniref:centrosomal protein of 126 kDa isoform X2 n=1 Tax=Tachysurus fulvidraco TaxID=1234273 RepID=UPI001FED7B3D|nr:centrosomal protein of 126 kDa isoform X2 [Tachysurus fulvidraco]
MQMPKDTLFYSNIRAGLDGEAEDDRQLLVREQKACRARARQYSVETNRRRKALEDKRRQRDIQEQRLREKILQKRKQRLQEATERFQRSHLPLSQRTRPASTTRAPNLDEALICIQGDQTPYTHGSSFFSGTSTLSSCNPSPKPPGGSSGPRSLRTVSAAQSFGKLIQERSLSDFKTSQPLFMKQLQGNLVKSQEQTQDHIVTQIRHAESLSSLDSLEKEVLHHGSGSNPDSLDPPEVHDTRILSIQRQQNYTNPPKSFLEKAISQQVLPCSSSSSSPSPVEDETSHEDQSVKHFLKEVEQCNITGQSQMSKIQTTLPCQMQVLAGASGHTVQQHGTTTQGSILWDKSTVAAPCKMQTASDTIPLEYLSMDQRSNNGAGEFSKCTKQAPQTAGRCLYSGASDLNKVSPSLENSVSQPVEAENLRNIEKYNTADDPNLTDENSDSRLAKDISPSSSKLIKEPDESLLDSLTNHIDLKSRKVRFLKGILKNCIEDGDANLSYTPGHFAFSKQMAIAVRDSLELTRSKGSDKESNKCIKKKLRWLDEVHIDGGENKLAETKSRSTQQAQQPLVNQQQGSYLSRYMNIPADIPKNNMTSSGPGEPNSTKQAWSDVGCQKEKKQEPTGVSREDKAASCAAGLVPQHAHSAKTGIGTISSHARRGIIIRPQSSSQNLHMSRIQGKVLVPRPPPRPEVTIKTGNTDECSQEKACLAVEQILYKDYTEVQPAPQSKILKTDDGTILAPVQHYYGNYNLCQSDGQVGSTTICFQKGILDRTPTDDEISLLWNGVRTALASKDARSPVRRPVLENNMAKNRTPALGYRKPPVLYQATVPITASKTDQMVHDQVSDAINGDEQVALHSAHFQRAAEVLQSQRGLSALSLEEQKLLQSLDRLNQRLQYVQDVAARNPGLKGIVALDPAYNQSPQPGERSRATLHRYHSGPADSRTRPHRRY